MVSNTKEIALEQTIQKHLTGFTTEELAGAPQPHNPSQFRIGYPHDFDRIIKKEGLLHILKKGLKIDNAD